MRSLLAILTCSLLLPAPLRGDKIEAGQELYFRSLYFFGSSPSPSCIAGQYFVFVNTSDLKLKKCEDGTITDLDTTSNHNLLSATHADTTTAAAARGDIITAQGVSPIWARLPVGAGGTVLHGGTEPVYSAVSLTADVTGLLASANGGTGNGFTRFAGPTTAEKTFTLPNATAAILTTNAAVTPAQGGTGQSTTPTAGFYLKGDGVNWGTSLGSASGTGACAANTWASVLNSDAAPTCTQPGFSNLNGIIALGQTPLTTRGDLMIAATATPVLGRLAVGASGTVIHGGTEPAYSAVSLTADVTGILGSANGGTGSGFTKFTGPATAEKTFTLPNASATVLTNNAAVTPAQGGTGQSTTATSGRYLKGDGTNWGTSSGSASGTGACAANTWASALNGDASPTCAQPAFSNVSGSLASTQDYTVGTAGTYTKVTTDAKGRVSSGTSTAHSGTGSCTNQFVRGVNDEAAPTCASVQNADLAGGSYTKGVLSAFCQGTVSANTTVFLTQMGATTTACTTTTAAAGMPMPASGTIKNLYVVLGTGGKTGDAVTIAKNGTNTTVTCTFGTGTSCNDLTHSFTVAAGDVLTAKVSTGASDSAANITITMEFWN